MTERSASPGRDHQPPHAAGPSFPSWPADSGAPEPAEPGKPEDLVGLRAGDYELLEAIGGGAMGVVYRGRKKGRQRQRAIKVLRPSDGNAEGLLHEALEHPNIVAIEDFGTLTDRQGHARPYLVMEFFGRAAALDRWVAEHHAPLDVRLRLVEEAARGVAHAHSLGVLHHDLKPANILVDAFGTARVSDFGLASLRIEAGHTPSGGTRAFQSPEQCVLGAAELDARSDVYALGATLFSVLTDGGVPVPLPPDSSREEAHRLKTESPPMLALLPASVPGSIHAILKKSLAPRREDRYDSATEFARALSKARAEAQTLPGKLRATAQGLCRTRPRLASALVGIVLGLAIAFALSFPLRSIRPLENWYLAKLPALDAASVQGFDEVRIVHMPPPFEMAALAAQLEVPGVQAAPARTWRPMHGAFIDAMSQAGARAIAMDIYFPQSWPELDAPMAEAIERSTQRGTPVVLGAQGWVVDAANRPAMPEAFALAGAHCGSLYVDKSGPLPLIPLVAQPPEGEALPSFVLATHAAVLQPSARSSAWIRDTVVRVQFWKPVQPSGNRMRTGLEVVLPTFIVQSVAEVPPVFHMGRQADWNMAYVQRAAFGIQALDDAKLDYAQLLRDSPEERSRKVSGRVLIVLDPYNDSTFDLQLEREILGGEVLAGAIQSMLAERTSRVMPDWMVLALSPLVAALGAIAGVLLLPATHRAATRWLLHALRAALLLALVALVCIGLLSIYAAFGIITPPYFWIPLVIIAFLSAVIAIHGISPRRRPKSLSPPSLGQLPAA